MAKDLARKGDSDTDMKHNTAVFFRFLAILALMFLGITAILPQSTYKDDEAVLPVWNDVDREADTDIITVYKEGIITGGIDGEYGKYELITAGETAYAVVRMYEGKKAAAYSFNGYLPENSQDYIDLAKEYGLWNDNFPKAEKTLSREEFSAAVYPLVKGEKEINNAKYLPEEDKLTYKKSVLGLYNRGIMLDTDIQKAYSPELQINRDDAVKIIMLCLEPDRRVKVKQPDYAQLEAELKEKMSGWQGDWSLCMKNYSTDETISINSHQVYSASLIKLFVAQTVYQKIAEGNLKETAKINDEVRKMLTYSDNDAWKYLARQLGGGSYSRGMSAMTLVSQASGFGDTGQFYKGSHKNYNFTSVNDCAMYLKMLLDGTVVNREYSDKILALLKQQQHTQKIPAGIPDGIRTANKTGELDYVQGDAAIVYAPNGTYILCIIGDSLENGYGQIGKIAELSRLVYEYLN